MTKKKNLAEEKIRKQKASDLVTYKVTASLVLLFLSIAAIKKLGAYYETLAGFDMLYPLTLWGIIGGVVFAAVCAALLITVHKAPVRFLAPWGIGLGFMTALTAFCMRKTYTDDFTLLCLVCGALLVLYVIFQLYRWEFFLFSAATFMAGSTFYQFSRGVGFNLYTLVIFFLLAALQAACFFCTYKASRNKGRLRLRKIRIQIFSPRSNPMPIYFAAAFWLVCGIAVLFLGSAFSYYCMFAAIIAEFIGAVYYTVQLR